MTRSTSLKVALGVLGALLSSAVMSAPASDEQGAAASIERVQQMVLESRSLLASGQRAEALALARQALALAKELPATPQTEAAVMAALDVTSKARAGGAAPAPDRSDRAEALLKELTAPKEANAAPAVGPDSPQGQTALARLMLQIGREMVPQSELLTLREYPSKLSQIEPADAEELLQIEEPWQKDIVGALERRVSFEFKGAPLGEVVNYLSALSGLNIVLDPRVGADNQPVHLTVQDMKLSSALKWLTNLTHLDYALQREAIFISSEEHLEGESVMRTYDISDLTLRSHDFGGSPTAARELEAFGQTEFDKLPEKYRAEVERTGEHWAQFIRNSVQPESWRTETESRSQNAISYRAGQLVVTNTAGVHRQIQKLLQAFRESRALMVSIQVRFVDISTDFLEQLGINWVGEEDTPGNRGVLMPGGSTIPSGFQSEPIGHDEAPPAVDATQQHPPYQWETANANLTEIGLESGLTRSQTGGLFIDWMLIRDFQVRALLDAVQKNHVGTLLSAPRITCFNTQRANIVVADEISYVASQTSGEEPEIGTLADGVLLEVQPFVSADRKYVTIELRPSVNKLQQLEGFLYRSYAEAMGLGYIIVERYVQLPQVSRRAISCTVVVPVGGTLMVGGLSRAQERSGRAGVPFLSQLPIAGRFFRTDSAVDNKTSLMILVRADLVEQQEQPLIE